MTRWLSVAVIGLVAVVASGQEAVLRRGVSVQLVPTKNAVAMPDADLGDAMVVAVTQKGSVYLNAEAASRESLTESIHRTLSAHPKQRIFVKSDARTAYAKVGTVLDALKKAGAYTPALLTDQKDPAEKTYPIPPKGLEIRVEAGSPPPAGAIVVDVLKSGESAAFKVDQQNVAIGDLLTEVTRRFKPKFERIVLVRVDGKAAFGDAVQAIDACRPTGARLVLAAPALEAQ